MPADRIPHNILHSVLEEGIRKTGRPRLRYKDVLKRHLMDFAIPPESWTATSKNRVPWRASLYEGCKHVAETSLEKLRQ
jgi:hypothetical protein